MILKVIFILIVNNIYLLFMVFFNFIFNYVIADIYMLIIYFYNYIKIFYMHLLSYLYLVSFSDIYNKKLNQGIDNLETDVGVYIELEEAELEFNNLRSVYSPVLKSNLFNPSINYMPIDSKFLSVYTDDVIGTDEEECEQSSTTDFDMGYVETHIPISMVSIFDFNYSTYFMKYLNISSNRTS